VLAHITPAEAKLLKARGGRGSVNPKTGLPEFQDDDFSGFDFGGEGNQQIYDAGGGGDYGGGQDASGDYETPQPSFATETVPGGQEFDPSMRAGTETLSAAPAFDPNQLADGAPGSTSMGVFGSTGQQEAAPLSQADLQYGQSPEAFRGVATGADSPSFLQRLSSGLGLGNIGGADLARLGLAGAGVGMGVQSRNAALQQARSSQGQIRNIANQAQQRAATTQQAMTGAAEDVAGRAAPAQAAIQALAAPYQQMGSQQVQQALSGTLTPMSAQSLQAAQAQQAQAQARSGGVGAAQGINQLEGLRQALLSNQYQQGLGTQQIGDRYAQSGITTGLAQGNLGSQYSNLATTTGLNASGIADQYTLRAIQAGLAGNQEAQRLSQAYFQSLGSILGGTPALRAQQPATTAVG
jgi:hypothetical protein